MYYFSDVVFMITMSVKIAAVTIIRCRVKIAVRFLGSGRIAFTAIVLVAFFLTKFLFFFLLVGLEVTTPAVSMHFTSTSYYTFPLALWLFIGYYKIKCCLIENLSVV